MNKNYIKALALCSSLLALDRTAQAAVSTSDGNSVTAWQGTPTYRNYNTSPLTLNPGGAFVAEANFGTGASGFGSLLNTFALGTSGNLSSIQLVLGNVAATYNLTLYNMGAGYVQSGSSFNPATNTIAYSVAGLSFTSPNAGAAGVTVIGFTGLDSVFLGTGNYGLAITPTTGPAAGMAWYRGGADTFAGDELYRFDGTLYGPINGSGAPYRHAALAVTVTPVPEPSSAALIGLGALIGVFSLRRRQA